MTKKIKLWLIFLLVHFSASLSGEAENPSAKELLIKSISEFNKDHCKEALRLLKKLDIRSNFDNTDDMVQAFKIRSICHCQLGELDKAKEAVRELFYLEPNYQFDPFVTPDAVVKLANDEKARLNEKNQHFLAIKEQIQKEEKIIFIEKKPTISTTLFPLGMNHFYLGSPIKGSVYLSLQGASLITNIAAFWWKQSYLEEYGGNHLRSPQLKSRFERAQLLQYISLSGLVLAYAVSVTDALVSYLQSSATMSIGE